MAGPRGHRDGGLGVLAGAADPADTDIKAFDETDSAASSTNTPRSHEVTQYSAPTRSSLPDVRMIPPRSQQVRPEPGFWSPTGSLLIVTGEILSPSCKKNYDAWRQSDQPAS